MSVYGKQRAALAFCALTVPSVMILARTNWLLATAAAIASAIVCCFAPKRDFSRIILLWNFIALGAATDLLCTSFEGGNELLGLLLLLLAAYASSQRVMLRAGAVAAFSLIILYSMLLGFSLPSLDGIRPKGNGQWYLVAAAFTPMLFADEGVPKWSLGGFVVLTLFASLVTTQSETFLKAMESVSILGVMQRLEPLASVAMTIGGFCLLGAICDVNRRLLAEAEKYSAPLNFLLGGAGIWISRLLGAPILAIGTAIFWGLLPFLPQSLEIQKKFRKNQKKA